MDHLSTNSTSNEEITRSIATPGSLSRKRERSSDSRQLYQLYAMHPLQQALTSHSGSEAKDLRHEQRRHCIGSTPEDTVAISTDEYTVGWVCALPLEMAAAKGMLDRIHPKLSEQDPDDHNGYTLGHMQGHNVVIACLPAGIYGTTPAATVAKDMLRTFKSIRFGLLVGIGGGAPSSTQDIRLGDIVVSQPNGINGGVIQFDRGKTVQEGEFQRTGSLNTPPQILLSALSCLQGDHMIQGSKISHFLSELVRKSPKKMKNKFNHQGSSNDFLFQAEYRHIDGVSTCDQCDRTQTIQREPRDDADPVIHYGTIASGNRVIKDGKTRDHMGKDLGVLCFEMEAAGLQDFPCLVIRGICDYADSHKNKIWQEYAAATAAAFAKELLSVLAPGNVVKAKPVPEPVYGFSGPQEVLPTTPEFQTPESLPPNWYNSSQGWQLQLGPCTPLYGPPYQ